MNTDGMEPRRAALLGFGRFGRALSWLLEEAGLAVRALDPGADVPSALRATTIPELVQGADVVIVAVPVPALPGALASLAPHLTPQMLVLDVGSVKTGPEQALADALGDRVPWCATHPLFGPASLARGERSMRVVVCPNTMHPDGAPRARRLYERIGCEVIEQSADDHDQIMARTHVLTFFIAKGLMDAGAGGDVPFAPPSFQALHRALEAVRIDAGHLFYAIQHENPFAATERRRLIDALQNVDDQISEAIDRRPEPAPMAIPDLGQPTRDLSDVRQQIDLLDRELFEVLARRAQLSLRAAQAKAKEGRAAIRDPERERRILEERARWAQEAGLDGQAIKDVFDSIMRFSRSLQRE